MSFYRNIDRSLYDDERVQMVGPIARAVYVYLCSNVQDDLSGIYTLSLAMAEEHTGWTRDQILDALEELAGAVGDGECGLAYYDRRARVVWVPNMLRKQAARGGKVGPKHVTHTVRQLDVLPRTNLKGRLVAYYGARGVRIPWGPPIQPPAEEPPPPPALVPVVAPEEREEVRAEIAQAHRSVSGYLAELDIMRREVEVAHKVQFGGLSRSDTQEGLAAAVDEHGWPRVQEVARHRAERVALGEAPQQLWRFLFRGNGFAAAHEEWSDMRREKEALAARRAEALEAEKRREAAANADNSAGIAEAEAWLNRTKPGGTACNS